MTEKQKQYFKLIIPVFTKINNNENISREEIKENFSAYLPYCNAEEHLFFDSAANSADLNETINIIKKSGVYNTYESMLETVKKLNADRDSETENFFDTEIEQLKVLYAAEDAAREHKESADETVNLHKKQIYELKGYIIQNGQTIRQHAGTIKELENANEILKTQVSQLTEAVQLLIEHAEGAKNQTEELADSDELLKKQSQDIEDALEKQEKTNIAQSKTNKFLFVITVIIFCITVFAVLSNPNIYSFIRNFF